MGSVSGHACTSLVIIVFSSMFAQGKPDHLPIAIIDQDQGALSQSIYNTCGPSIILLKFATGREQTAENERLLNQNKIWGYIHIPSGAQQRLVQCPGC